MTAALIRRILAEKRVLVLPLMFALLGNLGLYVALVYPLGLRVGSAGQRAAAAGRALESAEREHATASEARASRDRAALQLQKFYAEVLPADLSGARRLTYLRLAQLAQRSNLRYERRIVNWEQQRDSALTRLHVTMVLQGDYRDIRQFIYELEKAPEFVIIEDVALTQGGEARGDILLTLKLATYFRSGSHGT